MYHTGLRSETLKVPTPSVCHQVRGESIKRLLFIGVGCQVQALRSVEEDLGLDELYVLGTNCVDNPRNAEAGLGKGYVKLGRVFSSIKTNSFYRRLEKLAETRKKGKHIVAQTTIFQ